MNRVEININPLVLRWAREEAGFDLSEIADKVDVDSNRYKLWEKEGKNIPLGKLKTIANAYKRQLAVFLLPEVPARINKPKDYRNLSPVESKLSKKVLDVIREVTYFRETALEIQGETYWKSRYEWLDRAKKGIKDGESYSKNLRKLLDISMEDQLSWKPESAAYKNWRQAVEEKLGIFVFQFSMPIDEVHGFCFTDNLPYSIVTNSNHSYAGRIFTIFHELAHILRRQSGMCLYEKATEKQKEEWECNSFAGKFLAPSNLIEKTDDLDDIKTYASKLNISREVYLRRLKEEKLISDIKFFKLLDQIKATYKTTQKKAVLLSPKLKAELQEAKHFSIWY
jgi:Zn-dependent peptidase ImmA (M78 family)